MLALDVNAPQAAASGAASPAEASRSRRRRSLAHAARHDILRRLAPALRHDMVVHLQSVGMMAEAMGARLERGGASGDEMQATMSRLNRLARSAVEACVEVATWMDPAEDDATPLQAGVEETVRLLRSSLNFRGFGLTHEAADEQFLVGRSALRFLLPAAILVLCDAAEGPGELRIRSETSATHAVLVVDFTPRLASADDLALLPPEAAPAPLCWPEVQALAECESAEIQMHERQVILRLARSVARSPLKMAPIL